VASITNSSLFIKYWNLAGQRTPGFYLDKIIYANTIKPFKVLTKLNPYKILVTFDNIEELKKIKQHAPDVGLILRIRVAQYRKHVELSSKFGAHPGEAVDLIARPLHGFGCGSISFHVGSQCNNFDNYLQALNIAHSILKEAALRILKSVLRIKRAKRKNSGYWGVSGLNTHRM